MVSSVSGVNGVNGLAHHALLAMALATIVASRACACYGVISLEQAVHDLRRIQEWREPGFGDNATTIDNVADRELGHAKRLRRRRLPPAGAGPHVKRVGPAVLLEMVAGCLQGAVIAYGHNFTPGVPG